MLCRCFLLDMDDEQMLRTRADPREVRACGIRIHYDYYWVLGGGDEPSRVPTLHCSSCSVPSLRSSARHPRTLGTADPEPKANPRVQYLDQHWKIRGHLQMTHLFQEKRGGGGGRCQSKQIKARASNLNLGEVR